MFQNRVLFKGINADLTDNEEYVKMYKVWEACDEAGIEIPESVLEYLGIEEGLTPEENSIELSKEMISELEELVGREGHDARTYVIETEGLIKGVYRIEITLD